MKSWLLLLGRWLCMSSSLSWATVDEDSADPATISWMRWNGIAVRVAASATRVQYIEAESFVATNGNQVVRREPTWPLARGNSRKAQSRRKRASRTQPSGLHGQSFSADSSRAEISVRWRINHGLATDPNSRSDFVTFSCGCSRFSGEYRRTAAQRAGSF